MQTNSCREEKYWLHSPIGYGDKALKHDMRRLRDSWLEVQANQERGAIFAFLTAAFNLVQWWAAENEEVARAKRALSMSGLLVPDEVEPYGAVIAAAVAPARLDRRTLSKYSRVLRFAAAYKPRKKRLNKFIKKVGGLNCAAARFSRRLGRQRANS